MPRFDLNSYETVESRIKRFYEENPDGRIITENLTSSSDRSVSTWVVLAKIYLSAGDQANDLAKATGLAFEIDGGMGANQTSALENAETSAIGRALANAGYSGNKRASREEMEKVNRATQVAQSLDSITDVTELRRFYANRKAQGADEKELQAIQERARLLDSGSQDKGTGRSRNRSKIDG